MAKARWNTLLGGALLFALGWWVGRHREPDPTIEPAAATVTKVTAGNRVAEMASPPVELASTPVPPVEAAPMEFTSEDAAAVVEGLGGFERVKFGLWFGKHGSAAGRFQLFERDAAGGMSDALNPKLQETFELSDEDMGRLQHAVDHARAEVNRIEQTTAQTGWDEAHEKWIIDLPSYPEAGGQIFDALHQQLGAVLGEEKRSAFLALHSQSIDRQFDQLGTKERRFLVERSTTNGSPSLTIREEWKSNNGSGHSTSQLQLRNIAMKLGDLTRLLPPEFGVETPPTDG